MPTTDLSFLALHKDGTLLGDLLADLLTEHSDWRVGAAVRLPRHSLAYCVDKLDTWESDTDYLLADPETRLMVLPYRNRGRGRDDYAYLQESDPAANRSRFVDRVLRAQAGARRDVLISPWLIHGLTGRTHELNVTVDFARRTLDHSLAEDRQVLVGVEATEAIFADKTSLDAMLDEIVELDDAPPVYLRMATSAALGGRKQYENAAALSGLRAAVEALVENDHVVMLPQSGLAGWLMLGFGAHSFGAGIPATLQRCPLPVARSGGGGGQPALQWYFHPQLIGFVRADELGDLERVDGAESCDCPYCDATPPAPGPAFDRTAADKHFLRWCVALAEEIRQAPDRAEAVQQRVEAAARHWQTVQEAGVVLDPRSQPSHLATWTQVVA